MRTRENHALRTTGEAILPDANCDGNACLNTPTTAGTWTVGTAQGFGISCVHASTSQSCSTTEPNWTNGVNWTPIGNESLGPGPGKFSGLATNSSVEVITKAKFRLYAPSGQPAGTYTNAVSYIVTPVY
jgi:hypothetical protein